MFFHPRTEPCNTRKFSTVHFEIIKKICHCVRCTVSTGPLSFLANTWGLSEAISSGLARDGGLYVPKHSLPKPTFGQMKRLVPLLYKHKAHIVLEKLIHHSQVRFSKSSRS